MEFFALLSVATLIIALLAVAVFRKSRDYGTLLGAAALYYWSLYGAWSIVIDKTGGFSGKHYQYLESKLFPIELNREYLIALALYAGFIILIQLTLLASVRSRPVSNTPALLLRHGPILVLGFLAGIASYWIIREKLGDAWALSTSAYSYTRRQTDEWFTLHQVLNRAALLPPAIGLAALLSGARCRFFINVRRRYTLPAYVLLLGSMGLFTFILGNKNEVLAALATGILAYLGSAFRPKLWRVALTMICGLWFLSTIDFFRATPLTELGDAIGQRIESAGEVAQFVTSSNEAFGAHFSMYGVLAANVEPRFGYSLYALACSAVPRILWPDRPNDIYLYYSESVGAIQNQGYSLHHATGWYLNFGYAGVAAGALAFGLIWAYCLNAKARIHARERMTARLFAIVSPWLFASCVAPLVRAGPEGYKGFVIEGVLIPVSMLVLACKPVRLKRRLSWSHQRGWSLASAR